MHCANLNRDRELGAYWEKQFCVLAAKYGSIVVPHQLGRVGAARLFYHESQTWRQRILPDVTIWTETGCCEHHEIKHKSPTRRSLFGIERYRFDDLLWLSRKSEQPVFYTIHNHALSGGRDHHLNRIEHWFSANVRDLDRQWIARSISRTWVNGEPSTAEVLYWPQDLFRPLAQHFVSHMPPSAPSGASASAPLQSLKLVA